MTPPGLSLVVVTWNSGDVVGDLLDALLADPPEVPYEVIAIDNGSSDGTVDVLQRHPIGARVVVNGRNRGLAAANNQGIAAARGEFVLVCNPDIVPAPGALDALLAAAAAHPRAAFVVAKLTHRDGALLTGVGDLPTFREAFLGRRAARLRQVETGFWWDGWAHDQERQIGHGQEACYLVRRTALADIGTQDEGYRLDWEGVDWAARAHEAGWELWFCPTAEVVHIGGSSLSKAKFRWVLWSHIGMYRYFAQRRPVVAKPLMAVAIATRCLLKLAFLLRPDLYQRGLRVEEP